MQPIFDYQSQKGYNLTSLVYKQATSVPESGVSCRWYCVGLDHYDSRLSCKKPCTKLRLIV